MFGMFRAAKIKSLAIVEATYAMREYSAIDFQRLTVNEQGELGDETYELLKGYEKKSKYTGVEMVVACTLSAIKISFVANGGSFAIVPMGNQLVDKNHSFYGRHQELLKGFADYIMSSNVNFDNWHRNPLGLSPYLQHFCKTALNAIEDGRSLKGADVRGFLAAKIEGSVDRERNVADPYEEVYGKEVSSTTTSSHSVVDVSEDLNQKGTTVAELRRIAEDEGVDLDDLSDEEIKKEYEDLLGNVSEDEHSKKEKLTWSNGHFYEGELVNGKPHGIGKLTSPSGLVYEGKWVDGLFEGNDT